MASSSRLASTDNLVGLNILNIEEKKRRNQFIVVFCMITGWLNCKQEEKQICSSLLKSTLITIKGQGYARSHIVWRADESVCLVALNKQTQKKNNNNKYSIMQPRDRFLIDPTNVHPSS